MALFAAIASLFPALLATGAAWLYWDADPIDGLAWFNTGVVTIIALLAWICSAYLWWCFFVPA
jgi:hypothetical protein